MRTIFRGSYRTLSVLLIAGALLIPLFSLSLSPLPSVSPPSVSAESGCGSWANQPYRNTSGTIIGSGTWSCAIGDYGSRVSQACVISNGVWMDCDTDAWNIADDGTTYAECHAVPGASAVATQSWFYFKGEDGSTWSGYSPVYYIQRCDYGID